MKIAYIENREESEQQLYEAITSLKTLEEAKKFFQDLCTPNEIQAMADRWRVITPIKAGKPYRQIHDETGISVTTIGRVARNLLLGSGGYNLIYERTEKRTHEKSTSKTPNRRSKKRQAQQ